MVSWLGSIGLNVTANYTDLAYIASYWTEGGEKNANDGFLAAVHAGETSSTTSAAGPTSKA